MPSDRRSFIKLTGLTLLGLGAQPADKLIAGLAPTAATSAANPATAVVAAPADTKVITQPAQPTGKPLTAKQWAMVIDLAKCDKVKGCDKCSVGCHQEHNVPFFDNPKDELKWIWKEPYGDAFPDQANPHALIGGGYDKKQALVLCNHCDNPACVRVCPTQATFKRPDGIVMMDMHRCIGCRFCMAACPYGSRSFNWKDPRRGLDMKNLTSEYPTRTRGVVEKCNFCAERLAIGLGLKCAEVCPVGAISYGDIQDKNSVVYQKIKGNYNLRRKPSLGTGPQVYYLI